MTFCQKQDPLPSFSPRYSFFPTPFQPCSLPSWVIVTRKEMTFLLPSPHTFVFLITGWGWILNGETAGVWLQTPPLPFFLHRPTLSSICSHILNPASHSLPPVCQVPGTIGSHLGLEPGTVPWRPADRSPGSSLVCNCAAAVGRLARTPLITLDA